MVILRVHTETDSRFTKSVFNNLEFELCPNLINFLLCEDFWSREFFCDYCSFLR